MLSAKSYAKFFGESLLEEIFHLDEELTQVIANKKDPLVEEELENSMDIALTEAEEEAQKILDEAKKPNYHVYSAFGGKKLSSHSTERAAHKAAFKHSMKYPVHVWSAKGGEFGVGKPIAHWNEGKKTVYEHYENEMHSMMETELQMTEAEIQNTQEGMSHADRNRRATMIRQSVDQKPKPKKILALDPKEREKECTHEHTPYSGSVPCTGNRRCTMCGTIVDESEIKEDDMFLNHNGIAQHHDNRDAAHNHLSHKGWVKKSFDKYSHPNHPGIQLAINDAQPGATKIYQSH